MDPILEAIDEALKRKGLSDAAASKLAVGHPSLLKNLRMPRDGEKRYNLPALQKLADVLELELYFGPKREAPQPAPIVFDGSDFAHIPLHEAYLSAGPGVTNGEVATIEHLVFRQEWLRRIGIQPEHAALARISGESMAPGIQDGDIVLIDRTKRDIPVSKRTRVRGPVPIYAFIQDGEARVKRIERPEPSTLLLISDNPSFPPELVTDPHPDSIKLLGQVVWSGHVWR